MDGYSIALFLHIAGALGFFVALGPEWTGLWQIRSVMTLEQVRAWMGVLKSVGGNEHEYHERNTLKTWQMQFGNCPVLSEVQLAIPKAAAAS